MLDAVCEVLTEPPGVVEREDAPVLEDEWEDTFDVAEEATLLTLADEVRNWPPGGADDEAPPVGGVPEDAGGLLAGPLDVPEAVDWLGRMCVVDWLELAPEEEGVTPTIVSEDCCAGGVCDGSTYGFETLLLCVCVLLPSGPGVEEDDEDTSLVGGVEVGEAGGLAVGVT